jgi:hypothetical protein
MTPFEILVLIFFCFLASCLLCIMMILAGIDNTLHLIRMEIKALPYRNERKVQNAPDSPVPDPLPVPDDRREDVRL